MYSLHNLAIARATPRDKPYKLADGGGLYLDVRPSGAKIWRYRYELPTVKGERLYTIGEYGDRADQFTIQRAREAHAEARKCVAESRHPGDVRRDEFAARVEHAASTFAALAREWLTETKRPNPAKNVVGVGDHYYRQLHDALENDVLPKIGAYPARNVTSRQVLDVVRARADKPAWARIMHGACSQIFVYGIATGRCDNDPAASIKTLLPSPPRKNNPHLLLAEVPGFFDAIDAAPASRHLQKLGVKLLALTMVRPVELARAAWRDIDFDAALWSVPADDMKMGRAHIVPLSKQALAILRELRVMNGDTPRVFPERAPRPLKSAKAHALRNPKTADAKAKLDALGPHKLANIFVRFIREIGYQGRVTAHGLRGTASTALNAATREDGETRRFDKDVIELQLAHKPVGVRGDYNHADYMKQRAPMMQAWADMILPPKRPKLATVAKIAA